MRVKIRRYVFGVSARVNKLNDLAEYIAINSRKVEGLRICLLKLSVRLSGLLTGYCEC